MKKKQSTLYKGLSKSSHVNVWQYIANRQLLFAVSVLVFLSLLFYFFPNIDLKTSRMFYDAGKGFYLAHFPALLWVRKIGIDSLWLYGSISLLMIVAGSINPGRFPSSARKGIFLLATMGIGPGLIVNLLLKDHWGRARPRNIVEFGGQLPFSKAWEIVPYCENNCSFVSGEAGAAFAFLAILCVLPRKLPHLAILPLMLFVFAISFNRVLFGGHFLSDILLSWSIILVVIIALRDLILKKQIE